MMQLAGSAEPSGFDAGYDDDRKKPAADRKTAFDSKSSSASSSSASATAAAGAAEAKTGGWSCPACTFINVWKDAKCSVCTAGNPYMMIDDNLDGDDGCGQLNPFGPDPPPPSYQKPSDDMPTVDGSDCAPAFCGTVQAAGVAIVK
jgi:hypothetical protein